MEKTNNRASHQKAPASIDGVIFKIQAVIQQSRAVLSEEDLALLESCIVDLQEIKNNPPDPDNLVEDVGKVVFMLLKFLLSDGLMD